MADLHCYDPQGTQSFREQTGADGVGKNYFIDDCSDEDWRQQGRFEKCCYYWLNDGKMRISVILLIMIKCF